MTNLLERIQSGEGLDLEFKASLPEESVKWLKTVVAFANGRGGTLVIGVSDDREVLGISNPDPYSKCDDMVSVICNSCTPQIPVSTRVQTVGGKSLIVLDVFPGISRPYYIKDLGEENGTFIRVGATSRLADSLSLQDLRIQGAKTTFDTIENREVSVTPENTDSICSSLSRLGGKTVSSTDLENAQVIRSMDGHKVPTNAYALMMLDSPFKFTEFRCAVFSDSDGSAFLDHADYQCPIQNQLDLAHQFVLRNIRLIGKVEGLIRHDVYEIPEGVVRELILNAIQHRSYIDASRPIYLAIYNDRLG